VKIDFYKRLPGEDVNEIETVKLTYQQEERMMKLLSTFLQPQTRETRKYCVFRTKMWNSTITAAAAAACDIQYHKEIPASVGSLPASCESYGPIEERKVAGYNYDSTSIWPFDCLSKGIKVTATWHIAGRWPAITFTYILS